MKNLFYFLFALLTACHSSPEKIKGIAFQAPDKKISLQQFSSLQRIYPNWVAFSPTMFGGNIEEPQLIALPHQPWGVTPNGLNQCKKQADSLHLQVMIKPKIWFNYGLYSGSLKLETWEQWEMEYQKYILQQARTAQEMQVHLFCVGNEFREHVKHRPQYWEALIDSVRQVFKGKVTYAASWDNYQHIPFWHKLDFIGINAYFSLSMGLEIKEHELLNKWEIYTKQMEQVSQKHQKQILFTEYGYRNIKGNTLQPWSKHSSGDIDNKAQEQAYTYLYQQVWDKPWFAGGFLQQWHYEDNLDPKSDNGYSPQNKPAEKVVMNWYGR